MTIKLKDRQKLNNHLRAAVGLKPRKPGARHEPVMGHIISRAINESANKSDGDLELDRVACALQSYIEKIELVQDELEKEATK